jgi:predicted lipid-binding transport protein (Tim44 family)
LNKLLITLSIAAAGLTLSLAPHDADAKRLGGGKPVGMQRQQTPAPTNSQATPPTPAQAPTATPTPAANPGAAATAGAAAQQAGKRSWMGPLAGLAAGLGIAALASHFGFGEALANFMTIALVAILALVVVGWLLRRFGPKSARQTATAQSTDGMQFAGAGGAYMPPTQSYQNTPPMESTPLAAGTSASGTVAQAAPAAPTVQLPAGFDREGFERTAKALFIRMQAANDAGQVEDLRRFTTPELFAELRLDMQERGATQQQTDVEELNARIVDAAEENQQQIVSVHFNGRTRETVGGQSTTETFDEVWHFVRPADGSHGWAIAGIAPVQTPWTPTLH